MREWSLGVTDPYSLVLAADARLCTPEYCNDHAWEVALSGGDPPAVSIQTTYGLRARLMRVFYRFGEGNTVISEPASFSQPPRIQQFFTNYAHLLFTPFSGIDVSGEFWVPESQTLAGRLRLTNNSVIPRQIRVECAALLTPLLSGQMMSPFEEQKVTYLGGASEGLAPVLCLSGNARWSTGSFPALFIDLEMVPGNSEIIYWALSSLPDRASSFTRACSILERSWESEIARIELLNSQQMVEIETGNLAWDAALAFSQKAAFGLFLGPTSALEWPSFVLNRLPDQGYSRRWDGSDYDHLWSGQSPLDAYYLATFLLPGAPHLAEGLLRNFLATQAEDGFIDGKPGMGGQRGRFIAAPYLASLAWRIFQTTQDLPFLSEVFPGLLKFCQNWFSLDHDRDGDGFPEWDHSFQTGFDENPVFDRWHSWAQAIDITTVESPSLGALLYREINSLTQIAQKIGEQAALHDLKLAASRLRKEVEACWDPKRKTHRYRDRDTHLSLPGEILAKTAGNGFLAVNRDFSQPRRLVIEVFAGDETTRPAMISVQGETTTGLKGETIQARSFLWIQGRACLTTQNTFVRVDGLRIEGLSLLDKITVRTLNLTHEDITLLLPLWAHIPSPQRSKSLVKNQLQLGGPYHHTYGLSACPNLKQKPLPGICPEIYLPWNQLIGEGLLAYGFRQEAADLVSHILDAVASSLQQNKAFFRLYHVETGEASGERNALGGLAPVGLFLETLGIHFLSSTAIIVSGFSPFSQPVTIKYRGLKVIRAEKHTQIMFPDGQTTSITGSGTHLVTLT